MLVWSKWGSNLPRVVETISTYTYIRINAKLR